MAQFGLSLLLILLTTFCITGTVEPTVRRRSHAREFVESQCRSTQYPKLCVQCLSNYANTTTLQNPQQLAQVALTVSLARARYTRAYVTQMAKQLNQPRSGRYYQAVKDCLEQINDGVTQITQSIKELRQMGEDGEDAFIWHESNVQSWVGAALTDATTCIDGFPGNAVGGRVKATIKAKVLNVAQVTSNALALFNRFVARHRAARATKKYTPKQG